MQAEVALAEVEEWMEHPGLVAKEKYVDPESVDAHLRSVPLRLLISDPAMLVRYSDKR